MRLPPVSFVAATAKEIEVAAVLYQKFGVETPPPKLSLPRHLAKASVPLYVGEVVLLGQISHWMLPRSIPKLRPSLRSLFFEGHCYCQDWPHRLIADILPSKRPRGLPIDPEILARLRTAFTTYPKEHSGNTIIKVVRHRLSSRGYLLLSRTFGRCDRGAPDEIVSLDVASRLMRLEPGAIKALARDEHWRGYAGLDYPLFFGILVGDIMRWLQMQGAAMSIDQVAKTFGSTSPSIRNLVRLGIFGQAARRRYLDNPECLYVTSAEAELVKSNIRQHLAKQHH